MDEYHRLPGPFSPAQGSLGLRRTSATMSGGEGIEMQAAYILRRCQGLGCALPHSESSRHVAYLFLLLPCDLCAACDGVGSHFQTPPKRFCAATPPCRRMIWGRTIGGLTRSSRTTSATSARAEQRARALGCYAGRGARRSTGGMAVVHALVRMSLRMRLLYQQQTSVELSTAHPPCYPANLASSWCRH
ncbi:hypothetical protein B0H13DRAFT_2268373 [Mycena leptocephala]|nr:hypothetical protein B0H13DRAFT_2268373 [Mycena leptocephala]